MEKELEQTKITKGQINTLLLLYRFRFLNRLQIQRLENQKNHKRIQERLNELTKLEYINQDHDKKPKTVPAVYSLGIEARKYLKTNPNVQPALLDRIWREKSYSQEFKEHGLFLGDVCLSLIDLTNKANAKLEFHTKTDLYGIRNLIEPSPDAYFVIKEEMITKRYLLDILEDLPPKVLRRRVKQYIDYYHSNEWQNNNDKTFPEIILICPTKRTKNHLYYFIQSKLKDGSSPTFLLTTKDLINGSGLKRENLQKVLLKED